jgi:hypothetical protein
MVKRAHGFAMSLPPVHSLRRCRSSSFSRRGGRGQQIQSNDLLLVLEAMKMEANVTSQVAGKMKYEVLDGRTR